MKQLAPIAWILASLAPVAAQTYVVDDDGGAGVQFSDLPAAVAAVPPGAVLRVRAGSYTGVTIGKALSILGDDRDGVVVDGGVPIVIGPTMPGERVALSDLSFAVLPGTAITGAAGDVVLHHVAALAPVPEVAMTVTDSGNVHLVELWTVPALMPTPLSTPTPRLDVIRSVVELTDSIIEGHPPYFYRNGTPGVRAVQSRLLVTGTTVRGGNGADSLPCATWGCTLTNVIGDGGYAISLDQSSLTALDSVIRGGDAGRAVTVYNIFTGNGGHGLVLVNQSAARAEGTALWGGARAHAQSHVGEPAVVSPDSTLTQDPSSMPASIDLVGTPARGATLTFRVNALPGSASFLVLGYRSSFFPLPAPLIGELLASPDLLLSLGTVPAAGFLDLPVVLSASFPQDDTFVAQAITIEPGGNVAWASGSAPWVVKSP